MAILEKNHIRNFMLIIIKAIHNLQSSLQKEGIGIFVQFLSKTVGNSFFNSCCYSAWIFGQQLLCLKKCFFLSDNIYPIN